MRFVLLLVTFCLNICFALGLSKIDLAGDWYVLEEKTAEISTLNGKFSSMPRDVQKILQNGEAVSHLPSVNFPGAITKSTNELDGVVWYRKQVHLDKSWLKQNLVLSLGIIDDYDRTYFNGHLIGEIAENNSNNTNLRRKYNVPSELLAEGINVIAIQVRDIEGCGGFPSIKDDLYLEQLGNSVTRIPLAGEWIMKVHARGEESAKVITSGEELGLHKINLDVGDWKETVLPSTFEDKKMDPPGGVYWLFKEFELSERNSMDLLLGSVIGYAQIFINDTFLGRIDLSSPTANHYFGVKKLLVNQGRNLLSIRFMDVDGNGGILGPELYLQWDGERIITPSIAKMTRTVDDEPVASIYKNSQLASDYIGKGGISYPDFRHSGLAKNIEISSYSTTAEHFGALVDDSKDDSKAIQKAVEFLELNGGGSLILDEGTYHLQNPIYIRSSGIEIKGRGVEKSRLLFSRELNDKELRIESPKDGELVSWNTHFRIAFDPVHAKSVRLLLNGKEIIKKEKTVEDDPRHWLYAHAKVYRDQHVLQGENELKVITHWNDGTENVVKRSYKADFSDASKPDIGDFEIPGSDPAVIEFIGDYVSSESSVTSLGKQARRGDEFIYVSEEHSFTVGDFLYLLVKPHNEMRQSDPSSRRCVGQKSVYKIVSVEGKKLLLNQPHRFDFPVKSTLVKKFHPISNCRISGISIEQENKLWMDGIALLHSYNCEIKNVKIGNIGSNPIRLNLAKNCVISDCIFKDYQITGDQRTGYIGIGGFDNLLVGIKAYNLRHAPAFLQGASGNVFQDSEFHNSGALWEAAASENMIDSCFIHARRGTGSFGFGIFAQKEMDEVYSMSASSRNVIHNSRIQSPLAGICLGGNHENWLILNNQFEVSRGPAMIFTDRSFDFIIKGNVLSVHQPWQSAILIKDSDGAVIDFIDNRIFGAKRIFEGSQQHSLNENNQLVKSIPEILPAPHAPFSSLMEAQVKGDL